MVGVVVAAAVAALPPQGLVTRAAAGVVLVDLRGHVLRRLDGFRLDDAAEPARRPREVLLRKGSLSYALGRGGVRPVPRLRGGWPRTATGCHPGPVPFVICGYPWSLRTRRSTVYLSGRKVLGPLSSGSGFWVSAERCRSLRPAVGSAGIESEALGWTRGGRAVLDLPRKACAGSARQPGIYLVDPRTSRTSFLYRGHGRLWGSAFATH